eukprot:scaffold124873_cov30-Tisochrysis_lutea.AAC.1
MKQMPLDFFFLFSLVLWKAVSSVEVRDLAAAPDVSCRLPFCASRGAACAQLPPPSPLLSSLCAL